MAKISSNAAKIAGRYRHYRNVLSERLADGLKRMVIAVDRLQVANLSGGGAAGSYPVPVRRGTLRRGTFWEAGDDYAIAGNVAAHARAIHDGRMVTRDGREYAVRPREFLNDAVDKVDGLTMVSDSIHQGFAI